MRITGPGDGFRPAAVTGNRTAPPTASAPGEERQVLGLAGALADLGARLSAGVEFDQARIDGIKTVIANGEYRVNTAAVADKLIQGLRELLAAKA